MNKPMKGLMGAMLVLAALSAGGARADVASDSATRGDRADACQTAKYLAKAKAENTTGRGGPARVTGFGACDCSKQKLLGSGEQWTCTVDAHFQIEKTSSRRDDDRHGRRDKRDDDGPVGYSFGR